jgi:hypothetical protein
LAAVLCYCPGQNCSRLPNALAVRFEDHLVEHFMASFTPTQGRYLAFIHAYIGVHGYPPAESDIAAAMVVSGPSVNTMVKMLEKKGLINREPGKARSIQILVPEEEIPAWNNRKGDSPSRSAAKMKPAPLKMWVKDESKAPLATPAAPANLYVLTVFLTGGPVPAKFAKKVISRTIEIRGDQTLEDLHEILFKAYDRFDEHLYEFQFGKRPFDPEGIRYGTQDEQDDLHRDSRTTKMDDLTLKPGKVFGYWFDFGDDWFHQIQVDRIEKAIPTVQYPRIIRRVGKSPPQYSNDD